MSFRGFPKAGDRADMVAYLRTLSGSPVPLPEVTEAPAEGAPAEEAPTEEAPAGTEPPAQ